MEALPGREVEQPLSAVRGVARDFRGSAAAEPQQAAGQEVANLPEVG